MRSLELFTGAGGLALGIERAGFRHMALVEKDPHSCNTLRINSGVSVEAWPVYEMPVEQFDFQPYAGHVELLAGGPPCQPFSIGGKHKGDEDKRNMFPQIFRAIRELAPPAILLENVRGLTRESFRSYFDYIILQLQHPTIILKPNESWIEHKTRLQDIHEASSDDGLVYNISFKVIDCVNFGVPQRRHRVFIVGFRQDLNVFWNWPRENHSELALLYAQWVDYSYWREHGISKYPSIPDNLRAKVQRLERLIISPIGKRWRTVRDALLGLEDPIDGVPHPNITNHVGIPGARSYKGHTGSDFDGPAKTLKAGDHGVPGGENTLVLDDGSVRYFTIRESARLQTFPDEYLFGGSRTESMRQIGNAVPVIVGEMIARQIRTALLEVGVREYVVGESVNTMETENLLLFPPAGATLRRG
jgi:DNA (cytosine-5)-methyltransferase 1